MQRGVEPPFRDPGQSVGEQFGEFDQFGRGRVGAVLCRCNEAVERFGQWEECESCDALLDPLDPAFGSRHLGSDRGAWVGNAVGEAVDVAGETETVGGEVEQRFAGAPAPERHVLAVAG